MHFFQKLKQTPIYFLYFLCFLYFLLVPIGSFVGQTAIASSPETISFAQALQRAIASNPRLKLNATFAEAAEGQIEQANLSPNPVFGTEFENFLGTGPFNGVDRVEITFGVSQLIMTANKRQKRTELAKAERALIDWERDSLLAKVEASLHSAFVDVLLAQEFLELRREQLTLSESSAQETARLVEAARSPQVDQTRAQLAVRQQQLALQQAQWELKAAKSFLASFWGQSEKAQFSVAGKVVLDSEVPDFSKLAAKLTSTTALMRYTAEERIREAALDVQCARATPDFEVFAMGRYFNAVNDNMGFVAGIEIPWPLFDKNQGNIRTARAQLRAVGHEREAIRLELLIRLNSAYQQLLSARDDADLIQSELIPAAKAALHETEEGYSRSQFTQLAVLESHRALFDVREAYLEALRRYGLAQSEIEVLTRPSNL